jgi:hypothetical protein
MGIAWQSARWLCWLNANGLKMGRTLTLGRMNLYMSPEEFGELARRCGLPGPEVERHFTPFPQYAEPLFSALGATEVLSMDASNFESASIVHDLNEPVPAELHKAFDVVYDGGTLEHVFNFPEAFRSAMQMVKVGGSLLIHQAMNNMSGHGLYCFSPELFFRALSPENGFKVLNLHIFERYPRSAWYRVRDPAEAGRRALLVNWGLETEVLVHAVRTDDVPIFRRWPQQSDYSAQWAGGSDASVAADSKQVRLGLRSGLIGSTLGKVLGPLRDHALRGPRLGRIGKRWLNYRNYRIDNQPDVYVKDDPFHGGGPPVMAASTTPAATE